MISITSNKYLCKNGEKKLYIVVVYNLNSFSINVMILMKTAGFTRKTPRVFTIRTRR